MSAGIFVDRKFVLNETEIKEGTFCLGDLVRIRSYESPVQLSNNTIS